MFVPVRCVRCDVVQVGEAGLREMRYNARLAVLCLVHGWRNVRKKRDVP